MHTSTFFKKGIVSIALRRAGVCCRNGQQLIDGAWGWISAIMGWVSPWVVSGACPSAWPTWLVSRLTHHKIEIWFHRYPRVLAFTRGFFWLLSRNIIESFIGETEVLCCLAAYLAHIGGPDSGGWSMMIPFWWKIWVQITMDRDD